eukprot:TRINITY_DN2470_c0_g1_i11.p1 TRINITY_DN2470_c0_g1~~TRINITY_DN2470_c0_g1_i11.p1  ORF type:complete len:103 (-),score=7.98 TRINITY_DN2470_c0_g1_i11:555-824(-)
MVGNPSYTRRTCHIEVPYHYSKERQQKGDVKFNYVRTGEQGADCLTKPVNRATLRMCMKKMGLKDKAQKGKWLRGSVKFLEEGQPHASR